MSRERLESDLRSFFAGRGDVAAAYLFGSSARGTNRPQSDVDIGVLFVADPPKTLEGVQDILEDQFCALTKERVAGFRNILVHGYDDVRLEILEDVVRNRLGDLLAFCDAIRSRLIR